jgi:MYXO-CTERM domain-containing protein
LPLLWLALIAAHAAEEPCYGHAWDDRVDSDHFWVEWEPDAITEEQAVDIASYAEAARTVYVDELEWQLTERAVLYSVSDTDGPGIGGITQTLPCAGEQVPRIELFMGTYLDTTARNIAAHELAHGSQYAYMGQYLDSVASWVWWMEGVATWMATQADGNVDDWAEVSLGYLDNPHLALHHGVGGYLVQEQSHHMYGTAVLARYMEDVWGGTDTVRATWEWGAASSGEEIWFPDAVVGAGLDFDPFWTRWLATATVADLGWGDVLERGARPVRVVTRLPSSGAPAEERWPQGLGMNVVQFDREGGEDGKSLEVTFEGDPTPRWHVVLVRTEGAQPGSRVLDYVPLEVDEQGRASGWMSDFDGDVDGFLVVSPEAWTEEGFDYAWTAELARGRGPMEGTVVLVETPGGGCGCATGSTGGGWEGLVLMALAAVLRRRPSGKQDSQAED